MDLANWIMAGFTGVLAVFTSLLFFTSRRYTKVTEKLLQQSEAASKQSRAAFLGDMVVKALSLEERVMEQLPSPKSLLEGRSFIQPGSLTEDIAEMLGNIDEGLKRDFVRAVAGEDLKGKRRGGKNRKK